MNVQHLTASDFVRQPWKNGGGTTVELAAHASSGRVLWRLSIADVERSGPFSDFSGYERTIMLLDGDGMELTLEAAPPVRIDRAFEPFIFDGGVRTECRLLGGPVRDFNLMVDRARAHGALALQRIDAETPLRSACWTLVYCLRGPVRIRIDRADTMHRLERGELLRIDDAAEAKISAQGLAAPTMIATILIRPL